MERRLKGEPISFGLATGRVRGYRPLPFEESGRGISPEEVEGELTMLGKALEKVGQKLEQLEREAAETVGADKAALFQAHRLMLGDPMLVDGIRELIRKGVAAGDAVVRKTLEVRALFDALPDPYLRERAADVEDVGRRLFRSLKGIPDLEDLLEAEEPFILVAEDLAPSDTVGLSPERVAGLVTERGGPTSHTAILARSLGIPAVSGIEGALDLLPEGEMVCLDGDLGGLVAAPSASTLESFRKKREAFLKEKEELNSLKNLPARTTDGVDVELWGNVGKPGDAAGVLEAGGTGVGLFRTEFLFLGCQEPPDEEEQYGSYRKMLETMAPHPVVIRTLDAGGDKDIPFLKAWVGREDNPFLGYRAIRICLDRPELFLTQLRALLRAAPFGRLRIMFPMVTGVEEVRRAKEMLRESAAELASRGESFAFPEKVGIMVETPSAAAIADLLVREVDFFSIGTNDLTQYTLACDRMNPKMARLYDPLHPGVLRMLDATARAARKGDIELGMCGEMAADERALPLLVGMGFQDLSMTPSLIPRAKRSLRNMSADACRELVSRALTLSTAEEVRAFLDGEKLRS